MDRFSPDNYQDDLDDYLAGGTSAPSQPGNLADDAQRQAYLDQLTAQLLASLKLNVPQPDFSQATPAVDFDPEAARWPASGAPRIPRDHEPPLPEIGPVQVTGRSRMRR